jgi:hypothetical protein
MWEDNAGDAEARISLASGNLRTRQTARPGGIFQESLLCSATLWFGNFFRRQGNHLFRLPGCTHPRQYVIHRFLDASIGLVKLAGCLGDQLAQKITVGHGIKRIMDEI